VREGREGGRRVREIERRKRKIETKKRDWVILKETKIERGMVREEEREEKEERAKRDSRK
jgi:hypothetical protein